MSEIRVLIVEDDALIAKDISLVIEAEEGYRVSAIAYDSDRAAEELQQNTPDFVILDIELRSALTGIDLAKMINRQYQLPFIYLTSFADRATIEKVKTTKPMGYLVKPFDEKTIITTMEIGLYNHAQLWKEERPELTQQLLNRVLETPLTDREFTTLRHLLEGKTNKQMASDLFVSTNTVKTHLSNIFLKLDVQSRAQVFPRIQKLLNP